GGDGRRPRQCRCRSRPAGYLLRGRALPLRALAGRGLRYFRRLVLLVSQDERLHVQRDDRQTAFLDYVHRREPSVLPAAFSRACRDAAPLRRLSGRVPRLEHGLLIWLVYLRLLRCHLLLLPYPRLLEKARGRQQSVGCGRNHAGMDAVVAATVPPV